jgi:hypothetical protein
MKRFLLRMVRAAKLEAAVYEEVEADRSAIWQAFSVVLLSSLAAGVGSFHNGGMKGIVWQAGAALLGWWVWAWFAYMIGTRLLPTRETVSDHGELLRTIGFSSTPGILRAFALIDPISGAVYFGATIWMLAAMIVGVRQALDYNSTLRAIAVCLIGFPVYALFLLATLVFLGPWPA